MKGINGLLIMTGSGMPLLFENIDSSSSIDPALLSGYLQALDLFGRENITSNYFPENEKVIEKTSIDYGKRRILFIKLKTVKIAVLFDHKINNTEAIASKILKIGEKFLDSYQQELQRKIINLDAFEPFRKNILSDLISNDMSPSWVPRKVEKQNQLLQKQQDIDVFNKINGITTIQELATKNVLSYEETCKLLYIWWNENFIEFTNVLNKEDILILNRKGRDFLSVTNPKNICITYQSQLCPLAKLPGSESCTTLLRQIDGKKSISELKSENKQRPDINNEITMQCLIDNALVEPLSSERRSIFFSKKLVQDLVSVMQVHLKKQEVVNLMQEILNRLNTLEILNDIKIQGTEILIDYNHTIYKDLSLEQLKILDLKWMDVNYMLLQSISEKKMKKIIEDLISSLSIESFNNFRPEDLKRYEEFSEHLETLMAKI